MVVGAVEKVLDQGVWRGPGSPGDAGGGAVEIDVSAEQVDRDRTPDVGDGIADAVGAEAAPSGGEAAEPKFGEEREQPGFAGDGGGALSFGESVEPVAEIGPLTKQLRPGAANRIP